MSTLRVKLYYLYFGGQVSKYLPLIREEEINQAELTNFKPDLLKLFKNKAHTYRSASYKDTLSLPP